VLKLKGITDEISLNTLGDIYSNQEEPLLALGAYLSAIRISEIVDINRALKSAGYLLQLEAPEEAAKLISTLRAQTEETLSADQKTAIFVVESNIAESEGRLEDAAELLKEALKISPTSGESRLRLGEIYGKLAEEAIEEDEAKAFRIEARANLSLVIGDSDPSVGYKANLRLASMLVKSQNYIDALPLIEEAIRLKKGSKESIEQYKRRVERAAKRQKEKQERLEQKRRELRESLKNSEDADKNKVDEKSLKKKSENVKEGLEPSDQQDEK
jgi:hypothetical protein